jgi:FSR family fosmidomycin resistance protein-like MFS transporter
MAAGGGCDNERLGALRASQCPFGERFLAMNGMNLDTARTDAGGAGSIAGASQAEPTALRPPKPTRFGVIGAVSFVHLLNDMMQSVIVTIYPLLKHEFALSFVQIGMITLTFQLTASLLQPVVGAVTDKHPLPYSLPIGMCFTLAGLLLLSVAPSYPILLLSVALIGCGSSVFHPESSRVARMASGGRY